MPHLIRSPQHVRHGGLGRGAATRWLFRTHATALAVLVLLWVGVLVLLAMHRPLLAETTPSGVESTILGVALLITGIGGLIWRFVVYLLRALDDRDGQLEKLAASDAMTGALNHAAFMETLERDVLRSQRYRHLFSLMRVDIDFFKRINDGYGHATGDAVIVELANTVMDSLRNVDALGRVGGASFAIALPETPLEATEQLAERLRERIAGIEIATPRGDQIRFSVSIGVAGLDPVDVDAEHLLMRSESAMQRAKDKGRNRVEVDRPAGPAEPPPV